ncbi:hypothetical protein [Parabacteroides sp. ZJ-118]|uniref:hypothetical protein n=1 Tax=Parabacteroides sp. ZJ-118 TaxID=2709398 RepID=UPI001F156760|nr:hypothetical protein [Parabacteroides sp. ZJ-118]
MNETKILIIRENLHFLAEMMNYPRVLYNEQEATHKIEAVKKAGKPPIDRYYPLVTGFRLKTYIETGIFTDHETIFLEKGREKCQIEMHVLIREGGTVKDFDALHPLLKEYPEQIMFCTDDAHTFFLNQEHTNRMVKKSLDLGYDRYDVLRATSYNPATHYKILREGDSAGSIIQVNNLKNLTIQATHIQEACVYDEEKCTIPFQKPIHRNNFHTKLITLEKLTVKARGKQMRVIVCEDRKLITKEELSPVHTFDGFVKSDTERDILKLVILNRCQTTLSFMGLKVIPSLKHSNKGLFNSETFQFTSLFV